MGCAVVQKDTQVIYVRMHQARAMVLTADNMGTALTVNAHVMMATQVNVVKLNQTRVSIRNMSSAELMGAALTVNAHVMMATREIIVILLLLIVKEATLIGRLVHYHPRVVLELNGLM